MINGQMIVLSHQWKVQVFHHTYCQHQKNDVYKCIILIYLIFVPSNFVVILIVSILCLFMHYEIVCLLLYPFIIAPACSRVRYRRPIFHPSVLPSVNIYVDVRHLCQS